MLLRLNKVINFFFQAKVITVHESQNDYGKVVQRKVSIDFFFNFSLFFG